MNPQNLHDLLDEYAATEIPDTMNLMKDIHLRIESLPHVRTQPRRAVRRTWLMTAAACLIIAIGVFGFYQNQSSDSVIWQNPSFSAEVITPEATATPEFTGRVYQETIVAPEGHVLFNITEKSPTDDVEVKVVWAGMDGNEINIAWELSNDPRYGWIIVSDSVVTLADNGQTLERTDGEATEGIQGPIWSDGRRRLDLTQSWDATQLPLDSQTVDIILTMMIEPEAQPNQRPDITPFQVQFELSLPYNRPLVGPDEPITVESMGIPMSLSEIRYTPNSTYGVLCLPIGILDVYTPILDMLEEHRHLMEFENKRLSDDGGTECVDMRLPVQATMFENQLQLVFTQLYTLQGDYSPARFLAFSAAVYKTWGLEVELAEQGWGYEISPNESIPVVSNEIRIAISELAQEMLFDVIETDWFFVIPLH